MNATARVQTVQLAIYSTILVGTCAVARPSCPFQPSQCLLLVRCRYVGFRNEIAVVLSLQLANEIAHVGGNSLNGGHDATVP